MWLPAVSEFAYCIDSNRDGNVAIYHREGHVLWRSTAPFPNRHLFLFGSSPDLAFYDDLEQEMLVVRCERRGPLPSRGRSAPHPYCHGVWRSTTYNGHAACEEASTTIA
jgi:hypothetical protein